MRIEFEDDEYPELSRYLSDPKRKMRFLYFLEELFTHNTFDPMRDGLKLQNNQESFVRNAGVDIQSALQGVYPYFDKITDAINILGKNMEGSVIGRFPTEHVVHEVVKESEKPQRKVNDLDETDYSSTEGIDFSQAIAMFED